MDDTTQLASPTRKQRRQNQADARRENGPDVQGVTVVIPAFNEAGNIACLTQQILAEPWDDRVHLDKIIIVDDCSDDNTPAIAADLARKHDRVSVIRHAQRGGKNAGIRTGLAACQSDIIAFVDADMYLVPRCLTKTIGVLVDDPSLVASSPVNAPLPPRSWHERASRFQALLIADCRRLGAGSLLRVFAIRTTVTGTLDLPDNVYDDLYIMRWMANRGYRYVVCHNAVALIRASSGFRDFAKQTIRFWRAERALEQVLPGATVSRVRRGVVLRSLAYTIRREPLGFVLYVAWRSLIMTTPARWWAPIADHSKYDTSLSTKNLGPVPTK